jgi:O-antigen/teichoic acid export membrane protein
MKSVSTPILVRLAANSTWMFLERGIALAVAIGVGLYFVRYLGPEDFGAYSYALGLYGLFAAASRLGINTLVVNETVQHGAEHSRIFGSAFALRMTASLAGIVLLNLTSWLLDDGNASRQMVLVFSVALLFGPFETITHWFEANTRMRPIAVARSITSILIGAIRLGLILAGLSLVWFIWLIPVEAFLTAIFFLIAYRSSGFRTGHWKADSVLIKKFVREGVPLFFSALAVVIYMKIDLVMLGKMVPRADVGIYSAAVRISEMFYFIPVILAGLLFPYLIKAGNRDPHFFRQVIQVMSDGLAWVAFMFAVPVTLFSVPLVSLAYGREYLSSAGILVIHVWAGIFVFLETMRIRWLVIHKLTYFQFWTTTIGAVSNIVLNLYLIPRYRGYGAALATVVSYGLAVVFSCFLSSRTREIGIILIKSMLVPFRIPETIRTFALVRAAVDRTAQPSKGPEWSDPEVTQDVFR